MAGFGAETRRYLKRLQKAGVKVREIIIEAAEVGTMAAVETATEHTPPNGGAPIKGVNTRTGEMSQSWATDSQTTPTVSGETITTMTLRLLILLRNYIVICLMYPKNRMRECQLAALL